MISVSYKIPVNPEGTDVTLTRADVWKGLEAKAHNALPYVPSMTYCEVQDEGENWIQREIEFRGERFGERITLEPQNTVTFERTAGSVMGTILNEILETEDGELELRFSFNLELEGVEDGSREETDYEATMKGDYEKAVEATLAAIRRWVRDGEPASA
ncbi:MAG TPA: SRPBCC family protein [Solirubrobacterales bacterium]|nr:SRPBCC family protein [Solirubrobacterales bacterium]